METVLALWKEPRKSIKSVSILANDSLRKAMNSFEKLYSPEFLHNSEQDSGYPWTSVGHMAEKLSVRRLVSQSAEDYFQGHKVSKLCVEEVISAAIRGNYAQNVDRTHAFAGMVSMAANGATGILGGNAQLFALMIQESKAELRQGSSGDVTGIMKITTETPMGITTQWRVGTRDGHEEVFDKVLIATPWHDSKITLLNTDKTVPSYTFQQLFVTLLVTDAPQPNPEYFGYEASFERVPRTIVTAPPQEGASQPDFLTLSYVQSLEKPFYKKQWDTLYVVKLFSWNPIPSSTLNRIFGNGQVVWTHEKSWAAFPKLKPTEQLDKFEVDEGLYNLNAMERFVSTMETSTVAAKNVVGLLLQEWLGSRFVHGSNCNWSRPTLTEGENWDSWGCASG